MEEIDNIIKEHYAGKSLSTQQLGQIVNALKPGWQTKQLFKYAAAALLLLCLTAALLMNRTISQHHLLKKYAEEVAFNHLKDLKSDIITADVAELNQKMSKLNFDIHLPEAVLNNYNLLGGRYCSLDKRIAAQLKLENKEVGDVATLYILNKKEDKDLDKSFLVDATNVQIWDEQSVLFVLASN